MKRAIFLVFAAMLSITAFAQCIETFEQVYTMVAGDLGLDTLPVNGIKVVEATFRSTGIKPTDEPAAATQRLRNNNYLIAIYCGMERERLIKAYIHELCHVAQMQQGRLIVYKRYIAFEGVVYTKAIEWKERPFEREAIGKADELYDKYFNY